MTEERTYDHDHMLREITALVKRWGSQESVAGRLGVTPQFLSDVRLGRREVSEKVAKALGYRREPRFIKLKERE